MRANVEAVGVLFAARCTEFGVVYLFAIIIQRTMTGTEIDMSRFIS